MQAGLIQKDDIIIDAKSGVSGAGRSAKQNLLYTEIAEGINSYGVTKHRHMPEIEQVSSLTFMQLETVGGGAGAPLRCCLPLRGCLLAAHVVCCFVYIAAQCLPANELAS